MLLKNTAHRACAALAWKDDAIRSAMTNHRPRGEHFYTLRSGSNHPGKVFQQHPSFIRLPIVRYVGPRQPGFGFKERPPNSISALLGPRGKARIARALCRSIAKQPETGKNHSRTMPAQ